jgi:ABC-type branched-subunit amino acid transport system ATPase component
MLWIESLRVNFGATAILRNVTMAIEAGQRVALIGRNGAGKTTTLRAIMGLVQAQAARMEFDGAALSAVAPHKRTSLGIGYAPEERKLFGPFSVETNILLPAQVLGLSSAITSERLARVHAVLPELRDLADRKAAGLSGGQGKMVALGRALMVGTRLLLLDEPFQGLAPALALRYAEALRRLKDAEPGLAILITESNPALLKPLVDAAYAIERGEVRATAL